MTIKQIDLSTDFAKLKNAGAKEKREIHEHLAGKLEYVFSILNYEYTASSDETRNEQIYGRRLFNNKQSTPSAVTKDSSKDPGDDLTQEGRTLLKIFKENEGRREREILPIIEKLFGENKLEDPIQQKFSFNGTIELFSENAREKLIEFGTALSEYGNSIINKQHEYTEPEVVLYEEGVFEKGDEADRIITEFLNWRKKNKPETLFTFAQEHELWNWGHSSSFNKSSLESLNSRNWEELIFASDLSNYEYRGLSESWYDDGLPFQYIIETFWSMEKLCFSYDNEFLIVSDKNKRRLSIRLSTFLNLFLAAPGEDLWCGRSNNVNTESYFEELLELEKKDSVSLNLRSFSLSLETYFKSQGTPPKVDLLSCWGSIGSITGLNYMNSPHMIYLTKEDEESKSPFTSLISSLNEHIPILIPYYILGEFFKSEYDDKNFEQTPTNKGFFIEGLSEDFSANKLIQERLDLHKILKALEFDLLSEAILILTVTDLLMLGETKVLNWKYIFDLLETKSVSRSTRDLILQLFNEHPQEQSENLRRFRAQFKAELEESDPNVQLVKDCLLKGETKYVEFKQTLSWDINTKTKEKRIEETAMRAVCGFLNAEGGTLLIGVADDGKPIGIDLEIKKFHKNDDRLMLHFKNLLKNRLGDAALSLVGRSIVKYQGCKILLVTCPESPQEVWMDEAKFFVRSHPATDELKGPALTSYIKRRFPS